MYALMYNDRESNTGGFYGVSSIDLFETPDALKQFLKINMERIKSHSEEKVSDIKQYLKNPEKFHALIGLKLTEGDEHFSVMSKITSVSSQGFNESKQRVITVNRIQTDDVLKKELNRLEIQLDAIDRFFLAVDWDGINEALCKINWCEYSLVPAVIRS